MKDLYEYIITLHKLEDSDDFYHDLETTSGTTDIPERPLVNSVYPKRNFKVRPTVGNVFPRAKIRVYK